MGQLADCSRPDGLGRLQCRVVVRRDGGSNCGHGRFPQQWCRGPYRLGSAGVRATWCRGGRRGQRYRHLHRSLRAWVVRYGSAGGRGYRRDHAQGVICAAVHPRPLTRNRGGADDGFTLRADVCSGVREGRVRWRFLVIRRAYRELPCAGKKPAEWPYGRILRCAPTALAPAFEPPLRLGP